MTTFLRRIYNRYHKLGKKRNRKWRKPKGRDNKMREKRRGYGSVVSIGYKQPVFEKNTVIVRNIKELESAGKNTFFILGKVGKKKKTEIVKRANEMRINIENVNMKKFLKKVRYLENKEKSATGDKSK